jgi:PPOX class probable F420-dependent enzyme
MTQLTDDARALFEGTNIAHVATTMPDGAPHSVAVWIGMEGDRIAFLTSPGSRKARNLERDPRIAISITDREQPYVEAYVRGRVVERVGGEEGWAIIDRISEKYTGGPYPLRTDRVAFLVEAERAKAQSFA